MPVDPRVLKVDAGGAVGADDDLELVVPAVGHRAALHAVAQVVRAMQHRAGDLARLARRVVVEAEDEERRVDDMQQLEVGRRARELVARCRPLAAQVGREHADAAAERILGRGAGDDRVRVRADAAQVVAQLRLREAELGALGPEHIKVVGEAVAEHDDMLRVLVPLDVVVPVLRRHACARTEVIVLLHAERRAAPRVWLQLASAQLDRKLHGRDDQRRRARDLHVRGARHRVVREDEKRVDVEHDRRVVVEVGFEPIVLDVRCLVARILVQRRLQLRAVAREELGDGAARALEAGCREERRDLLEVLGA